ncbi:ABC transporter ATP-binding protein [Radicibacter daui]|uniref:ABC transporter ATP-binding protein n=1 Tax=Radicibacter daui TaxID=3064829 RepID=UPI0040469E92
MRDAAAGTAPDPVPGRPPGPATPGNLAALKHVPALLALVWASSPPLTLASFGLRILRALMPLAALYVGKLILDEVVRLVALPSPGPHLADWLKDGRIDPLIGWMALEFALAIGSDLISRLVSVVDSLVSELYTNTVSVRLMRHAAALDLKHFEDSEQQDRLDRAQKQVMGRAPLLPQLLGQFQNLITVLSLAAGLIAYAPWLILVLFIALLPAFLGETHFNARGYLLNFARTPQRRRLDYLRAAASSTESAKEVKIFGLVDFMIDQFLALSRSIFAANRKLAIRRTIWGGLLTSIGSIAYYGAYAFFVWRTLSGSYSIGDLSFLAASFLRLRGLLEDMLLGFSQLAGQALYLDDIFSFFEIRPEIRSAGTPLPFPRPIEQGFAFEDVGFRYPGTQRWAVRGLSFTLAAGEVLALVGENGAGKTTIVKLLSRLYDPDEGRVLLDGHDLRDYDIDAVRAHIGVIFQDFVRYQFTAGENIAIGRIDAREDAPRISEAARRGLADGVIGKLPGGYGQPLGKRFNSGMELSGGEWQKIAIARAYMREADLLILDEPTAALDARAEYEVFQRLRDLSAGRTAIIISHRFSTVRMADRILVLEGGHVIEAGSHDELVAAGGHYADLFNLQAAGYR